jgi:hypothetical protein
LFAFVRAFVRLPAAVHLLLGYELPCRNEVCERSNAR